MAAAGSPDTGYGGHELEMTLMILDGSSKGKADPAFEAHSGVISAIEYRRQSQPIGQRESGPKMTDHAVYSMVRIRKMKAAIPPRSEATLTA